MFTHPKYKKQKKSRIPYLGNIQSLPSYLFRAAVGNETAQTVIANLNRQSEIPSNILKADLKHFKLNDYLLHYDRITTLTLNDIGRELCRIQFTTRGHYDNDLFRGNITGAKLEECMENATELLAQCFEEKDASRLDRVGKCWSTFITDSEALFRLTKSLKDKDGFCQARDAFKRLFTTAACALIDYSKDSIPNQLKKGWQHDIVLLVTLYQYGLLLYTNDYFNFPRLVFLSSDVKSDDSDSDKTAMSLMREWESVMRSIGVKRNHSCFHHTHMDINNLHRILRCYTLQSEKSDAFGEHKEVTDKLSELVDKLREFAAGFGEYYENFEWLNKDDAFHFICIDHINKKLEGEQGMQDIKQLQARFNYVMEKVSDHHTDKESGRVDMDIAHVHKAAEGINIGNLYRGKSNRFKIPHLWLHLINRFAQQKRIELIQYCINQKVLCNYTVKITKNRALKSYLKRAKKAQRKVAEIKSLGSELIALLQTICIKDPIKRMMNVRKEVGYVIREVLNTPSVDTHRNPLSVNRLMPGFPSLVCAGLNIETPTPLTVETSKTLGRNREYFQVYTVNEDDFNFDEGHVLHFTLCDQDDYYCTPEYIKEKFIKNHTNIKAMFSMRPCRVGCLDYTVYLYKERQNDMQWL